MPRLAIFWHKLKPESVITKDGSREAREPILCWIQDESFPTTFFGVDNRLKP